MYWQLRSSQLPLGIKPVWELLDAITELRQGLSLSDDPITKTDLKALADGWDRKEAQVSLALLGKWSLILPTGE